MPSLFGNDDSRGATTDRSLPADAFEEFGSETSPPAPSVTTSHSSGVRVAAGLVLGTLAVGALWGVVRRPVPTEAEVTIESSPTGASVDIGGAPRGRTPLTVSVPAGTLELTVRAAGVERTIPLTVQAGETVRQLVDLTPPTAAIAPAEIRSALPATPRPTVQGLTGAGPTISGPTVSGPTVSSGIAAPADPAAPARPRGGTGWLAVDTPLAFEVVENDQVLGRTDLDRVMLPAGTHVLRFVNTETGYSTERTIEAEPGRAAALKIDVPQSTLAVNARPWAEVFVDGLRVGDTPIGNYAIPIGRHEIVLRHPEFGERRRTVVVRSGEPVRLGVDFRDGER